MEDRGGWLKLFLLGNTMTPPDAETRAVRTVEAITGREWGDIREAVLKEREARRT